MTNIARVGWLNKGFWGALCLGLLSFLPHSWLGFTLPKALLLALTLGIWFLIHTRRKGLTCFSRHSWPIICYFGILFLATLFSSAPLSSFFGASVAMMGFQLYLLFFAGFIFTHTLGEESREQFFRMISVVHVATGCYALIQWLGLDPLAFWWDNDALLHRSFSFLGNPNWLASFMVLTMPVIFQSAFGKKYFWLILAAEWLVLFSTGSKAGLIGGLLLSSVLLWNRLKNIRLLIPGLALIVVGTTIFLSSLYPDSFSFLRSSEARRLIWQDTFTLIQQNPWGHGLDTFGFHYAGRINPRLFEYEDFTATIDLPHSQPLQILFESGLPGLLFFAIAISSLLYPHLKTTGPQNLLAWGLLSYLITNLFGFETIVTGFVFWMLLGMLPNRNSKTPRSARSTQILFGLLGTVLIALAWLQLSHLRANSLYSSGFEALSGKDIQGVAAVVRAAEIYPYDRVYLLQASEALLAVEDPSPLLLQKTAELLAQLEKLGNGLDPEVPTLKAWLAARHGNAGEAERILTEAIQKYPLKFRNYLIGMEIFRLLKKPAQEASLKNSLRAILPSFWNKLETEPGRIFQKNYPWIQELLQSEEAPEA